MNRKLMALIILVGAFMFVLHVEAASPIYINNSYTTTSAGSHTFGLNAFNTIQDGINAVDVDGTIYVAKGAYAENLIIEKSLSIIGDGAVTSQGSSFAYPTVDGGTSTSSATIIVNGTGTPITVTIRNFNIIRGGYGINVLQNAIMFVDKNTVSGYRKNGITFGSVMFPGYGGVRGTISNNVVIGSGPTSTVSQNGIQVAENNTALIIDNHVSNHMYTVPDSWWATGILVYRSRDVLIARNTLTANQDGINIKQADGNVIIDNKINNESSTEAGILISDSQDTAYVSRENIIKRNTIIGGDTGIWIDYTSGNSYSNNDISNSTNSIYSLNSDNNTFIDNTFNKNNIDSETIKRTSLKNETVPTDTRKKSGEGMVLGVETFNFLIDLSAGNEGNDVVQLQKILTSEKFFNADITGYFGLLTKDALIKWQIKNNIPATGYFGKMSRTIINSKNNQ